MRRVLAISLAVAAACGLAATVWLAHALSPVAGPDAAEVAFEVEPGDTLVRVATRLQGAGLVRDARIAEWWARLRGLAPRLRAGEYGLSPAMSPERIFEQIASGQVLTHPVVVPEGFTMAQIAERLAAEGLADAHAFTAVCTDPEFARELSLPGPTLEGYLFPETYRLPRRLDPREIARAMVAQFFEAWRPLAPEAERRGLTLREVVTLASIVEKETGAPDERPLIASVFANRLARGMRLESDPTTIYGIPDFDGNLRRSDLESESNPYNTYRIAGLPPGPIANPGLASLRAVVEPAESQYLYFVSRNDGTHVFSRSYSEHLAAVNRHQRRRTGS
jgi:peptidoglycan lytic transglycosylase G